MIEIKNLSLKYENTDSLALDNINLEVEAGNFAVILGASGCGKTSLLNLLAGFLFTEEGSIEVNKKRVTSPGADRCVIFQENALMPWLSVQENIALGLNFQNLAKDQIHQKVQEALSWVDLNDFKDNYTYELSGGMQQRVGLARALVTNPDILLMDEPLGALDAITREEVQKIVLSLWNKSQKTILMITHSIEEALFMATDLIIMTPRPGKIYKQYKLNFARDFLKGNDPKEIKQSSEFITLKKEILQIIQDTSQ